MDDQDFSILSSRQEHLMREMNAYLKAIDITDSPGDNSAATLKIMNSQNKTLSSRLKVPPLATITSSSSSSSSSSGSTDSTTKDNSTTNDNTEVEKKKRQGRRRSLTNHLNSIDEQANGSKISADCYNHIYNEGQKVVYTNSEGSCLAVITKVHYDDELQPYYTIEIEGREKQTDNNHLSRFNESEYEYFNEAQTTTSSSQFEDDSLVAMAKRLDDSQTIISDPSLICGTKEKTLLTLPNLPNITKKLGMSKGKQPTQRPELDSPLHSDDDDDNRNIPSDSSSSGSVEVFDYNGMTREQVMSMKRERNSPIDAPSGSNEEGRRSRGGTGEKNGETRRARRHNRSPTEDKRTSRHHSSSRSRRKRRDKDRKRRQHRHDDDDESMHGIGFNTRVNKPDMDDRRRRTVHNDRPPIQQSQPRRHHLPHTQTKNQIDHHGDSSDSDEHSTYDSDECTQIFYESTDDEWCSADSEEELDATGTSVTDAVNSLNKKRGVKSLFGLR